MQVVRARHVDEAYYVLCQSLDNSGTFLETRNGKAKKFKTPVCTEFINPKNRILFNEKRTYPTFFTFFEPLWMLAGKKDVEFVSFFVKNMKTYSDNGEDYHAAYGYRWRKHFGFDQLNEVVDHLRKYPNSRRAVVSIWDPVVDLNKEGLDFPCNDMIKFYIEDSKLHMIVFNRSNDLIWGLTTANVAQFSILQEYIAGRLGVPMGSYYHFSSDLHAYLPLFDEVKQTDYYISPYDTRLPNVDLFDTQGETIHPELWDEDLHHFMSEAYKFNYISYTTKFNFPYFNEVVLPLWNAHMALKAKEFKEAENETSLCLAWDWKLAAKQCIARRHQNYLAKK